MPRILFGVTVPVTANAFLRDQMTALIELGWDVHLAVSPDAGFDRLRGIPGLTLHALAMRREPAPAHDATALVRWGRLVGRLQPDVVVASTPKAGLLGMLAARMRHVPVRIYHVRGLRAEGLIGLMRRVSLTTERIAITCATIVQVDSPSLLRVMRQRGLLGPDEGMVLGSGSATGVDTEHFHPPTPDERALARELAGLTESDIAVGFLGRIVRDKGIIELVDAVAQVRTRNPNVQLILVGPIEDEAHASDVRAALTANPWVRLPGPTDDPRPWYHAFDIFCLPSYREGFPISNLEAAASGLPVVTTDATGCVDSVVPDVTGLVVCVKDSEQLTAGIQQLALDHGLRRNMGTDGREWVVREFSQGLVRQLAIDALSHGSHLGGTSRA